MKYIVLLINLIFINSLNSEEYQLFEYKPIRTSTVSSKVLNDLECHIQEGHQYRAANLVTWAHETTHGINSILRNKYGRPALYLTGNEFAYLKPAQKRLNHVAKIVPPLLHDHLYNLYLVEQQRDWDDDPYYILDEWSAYCNGCLLRNELLMKEDESEVLFMMQFSVFAGYLCMIEKQPDLIEFVKFNTHRSFNIYYRSPGNMTEVNKYLSFIRQDKRMEEFRVNMKNIFGTKWCSQIWEF